MNEIETELSNIMATLGDPDFGRLYDLKAGNKMVRRANEILKELGKPPLNPKLYGDGND
jgi:hypothetical protein